MCVKSRSLRGPLGAGQSSEGPHWWQSLLHRGVIAFYPVVQVLPVHVPDRIFRSELGIDLTNHLRIAVRSVGDNRQRVVNANGRSGLPQENPCCFGISPRGQPEIDQLTKLIDGRLQVAPSATNPNVRLVHIPLEPAPGTVRPTGPFADLGAELPDPTVDGRGINHHSALGQHVADFAARQRVAAVCQSARNIDPPWKVVIRVLPDAANDVAEAGQTLIRRGS